MKGVVTPEVWKAGSREEAAGGRKSGNTLLSQKRERHSPYGGAGGAAIKYSPCKICKAKMHTPGAHYCQQCAYKKGICTMCGRKILDVSGYKQSTV
eukprot:TRINITY_DN8202_c0_g1_i1.p1 TRINITY_DN8202_c0_g1~~TRINITY_DN8202_c0_g1_i1.p1  ORF type:complete len:108 (-),score=22.93 TRINITY_DN8202_c0_g1_i1:11-298(-)